MELIDKAILAGKAAYAAGFRGTALIHAIAIAGAESAYNPNAKGDVELQTAKWGPSLGLFQIRSLTPAYLHMEPIRDANKLLDPYYNARAAYQISKKGTDFGPWSTWTNAAYERYSQIAAQVSESLEEVKKKAPLILLVILVITIIILLAYKS